MSTKHRELTPTDRLMIYVRGFKKGASGSAHTDAEMAQEDFVAGHKAGRAAAIFAYEEASGKYGVTLSPLRAL